MRRALVIGHVAFEDLGTLAPALAEAGFAVRTLQAGVDPLPVADDMAADLLVVLGGPIGVYDEAVYPFLATEKNLIGERLRRGGVTLGICLGAQLMAAALGARVYPGSAGKEIGWGSLLPTPSGRACAELAPLFAPGVSVLHWNGDTFDLPPGATHLAASDRYAQQVFVYGDHGWGFQCHPEVRGRDLERWLIGHACELAQAGIDVNALRAETRTRAETLERAAGHVWRNWLCARFD
ncbi:MAG: glutamine amidotransferase [Pseudomonadota bacterium]